VPGLQTNNAVGFSDEDTPHLNVRGAPLSCVTAIGLSSHANNRLVLKSPPPLTFQGDDSAADEEAVEGDVSNKAEAIIKLLRRLSRQGERAVVFSHFPEVLRVVAKACVANNIVVAAGSPRKAIAKFKQGHLCTAVLLPTKRGADGLNLTEATHVVLVEPLLAPGVESQAVSRVHRIGQTRETFVHRFVVSETVEAAIDLFNRSPAHSSLGANRLASSVGGGRGGDIWLT
jgi:SNF2 family DNA or RNA helicase